MLKFIKYNYNNDDKRKKHKMRLSTPCRFGKSVDDAENKDDDGYEYVHDYGNYNAV